MNLRRLLQLGALVLALGLLDSSRASLRPEYGGSLRLAVFEPVSLDPVKLASPTDGTLSGLVFETLLEARPGGSLAAGLAREWKLSADSTSLSLQLAAARFSNGVPVTSGAVLASLERLRETPQGWLVANLDFSASEVLEQALVLRFKSPDPLMPFLLAHPATAITRAGPDGILGTGPFAAAIGNRERRKTILVPNVYHREGPPFLESVEAIQFTTAEEALRELERGQLDLAPVPIDQADRLAGGAPGLKLHTLENIETISLLLHPQRFGSRQKSWILEHMDLESMVSFRLRGYGALARAFEAHLTPFTSLEPPQKPSDEPMPDLSRPMRLIFPEHVPLAHQLAARIRGDLQGHGARIEVEPVSPLRFGERLQRQDYDLALVFVHSLGTPPLTLLEWYRILRLPNPRMNDRLASWLTADESLRSQSSVLPLFQTQLLYAAQARLVDLAWTQDARPILEQTWWRPRLDFPER